MIKKYSNRQVFVIPDKKMETVFVLFLDSKTFFP